MENTWFFVLSAPSFADTMSKAALNTVISMSVVFGVLVLIIFMISGFKIFPYLEAKKKEREQANTSQNVANTFENQIEQREEQQDVEEELVDDTELVAVIAAAIAASTGTSTDGFVVRSIRRR